MTDEHETDRDQDEAGPDGSVDESPASPGADRRPRRARMVAAGVMGVVAVVLLHATVLGAWTVRTALDSERFADQIQEIVQSEEVSSALAEVVLDEVGESIDIRTPLAEITPETLEPLVDVLLAGVEAALEDQLASAIRSDAVSGAVAAAAGEAHALAVDVLEGESVVDGLAVEDGAVRVNLLPVVGRALELVQSFGVLSDVELPELERGGDPDEQVAALEDALDVDLPDRFGQPIVFQSDTLEEVGATVDLARSLLLFTRRVLWILLVVGIGLAVGSVWYSTRRWRAAGFLAAGVVLLTLLTRATVGTIADRVPEAVVTPGARATVREVVFGLENSLNRTLFWYSLLTVGAFALAAFVRYRWPTAFGSGGHEEPADPAGAARSELG